jgi:hypothetical protein
MRLSLASLVLVVVPASLGACQGGSLVGTQSRPDAADAQAARVPLNHRASGATCPAARGAGSGPSAECTSNDGGPPAGIFTEPNQCLTDSDCTAGLNGRCQALAAPFAVCGTTCTYDGCFADSDCPGNEPCECRPSSAEASTNSCLTGGNCRVDSDCGAGSYCSPSQLAGGCFCPSPALCSPDSGGACYAGNQQVSCACGDACGHSYYCHTKKDTCLDDSDCTSGGTCNYDTVNGIWDCATCFPLL